jgi:hypothetical protein
VGSTSATSVAAAGSVAGAGRVRASARREASSGVWYRASARPANGSNAANAVTHTHTHRHTDTDTHRHVHGRLSQHIRPVYVHTSPH